MAGFFIPFWKNAPFFRLLLPFALGIIAQWYRSGSVILPLTIFGISFLLILLRSALSTVNRYRTRFVAGLLVFAGLMALGSILCFFKDPRNRANWIGTHIESGDRILAEIRSVPVEKKNWYKLEAIARFRIRFGRITPLSGGLLLYFAKDSSLLNMKPGRQILLASKPLPILGPGNPGGFDYRRYSLFRGFTHQAFLRSGDYMLPLQPELPWWQSFMPSLQAKVLAIMRRYIPGKTECGLAEALLIGYKEDLDPDLVSSYTNTGLAHVIAISGMHLALIYWLLMKLVQPLRRGRMKFLAPFLTIACLWTFTFLAGAQASILRSALMFTCIILGRAISRNQSIYNSLAASAFILLCLNPYWLWDLGFQLSYAAVLSLVIFMLPVYRSLSFSNGLVDQLWKSVAVSIAAQILTTPLSIYHFHQFPVYFIPANLIAVPVSTLILFGEILLCAVSWASPIAGCIGSVLSWLIRWLNAMIAHLDSLPFSTWTNLQISASQAIILYILIIVLYFLRSDRRWLITALSLSAVFMALRTHSFLTKAREKKLLVYQVPGKTAMDFFNGNCRFFLGHEPDARQLDFLITPFRIANRSRRFCPAGPKPPFIHFAGKKILWLERDIRFRPVPRPLKADLVILSAGSAHTDLDELSRVFSIAILVIDSSVPAREARSIRQKARSLFIPCHDLRSQGFFLMNC